MAVGTAEWLDATSALTSRRFASRPSIDASTSRASSTALGSQATYVAVPYQLRLLTHSTLAVGSLGLAELLPLIVFGLYGGVLADRLNRRRLIISMEQVLMLSTAVLVRERPAPASPGVDPLRRRLHGLRRRKSPDGQVSKALNQMFVPHEMQRAASTLANLSSTTASIIGPALGGLAAIVLGPGSVYLANLVTFTLSLDHAVFITSNGRQREGRRR
jgi:MFS family permease